MYKTSSLVDVINNYDKSLSLDGYKMMAARWLFQYSDIDIDRYSFEEWYREKPTCENVIYMSILKKIKSQKGKRELRSYLSALSKVILC